VGYLINSGSGYVSDAVQVASTGDYAYINKGYLSDVVVVGDTTKENYNFLKEGYQGTTIADIVGNGLVFFLQLYD
jgi:hypothetical protein